MPYSDSRFDDAVAGVLRAICPQTCLDVGPGAGKYGLMVKALRGSLVRLTGVEVEPDYVDAFRLHETYDEIRTDDASSLIESNLSADYDVVILGDVLEHVRKSAGADLLNFLIYRSRFVLVVYPSRYVQGVVDGHRSEAHISVWTGRDFEWCNHLALFTPQGQNFVILEGYLSPNGSVASLKPVLESFRTEADRFVERIEAG